MTPTVTDDFNLMGVVDAAACTLWRMLRDKPLTAGTADADASGHGNVDGLDYSIWLANFAPTASAFASLSSVAVPAPSTFLLDGDGLPLLLRRGRY